MATALTLSGPTGYKGGSAQTSGPFVGYESSMNYVLRYSFKTPSSGYITSLEFATTLRHYLGNAGTTFTIRAKVTTSSTSHVNAGSATTDYDGSFTISGTASQDKSCTISGLKLSPNTTYYLYLFPGGTDGFLKYCYDNSGTDQSSLSYEATLPKSTITLSDATPVMGDKITITVTRASTDLTHTLRYKFGDTSGTIGTGVTTSKVWTVPTSLAADIMNSLSGKGTVYCDTYFGSTLLGTTSVTFTATVPAASAPTVSANSVTVGDILTITTNRKASAFTHTLRYTLGGTTETIKTGVTTSHKWTVTDLVSLIPNASSGTITITCTTYNGTAKVGSATVAVTYNAPAASAVSLSVSNVALGNKQTMTITRKSSAYVHKLIYAIESASGTVASNVGTSYEWTVPLSLATTIPAKTSGTVTITCETYNGTAKIGSVTATFTVTVPDNSTTRPTVSITVSPVSDLASPFDEYYLVGKTKVKVEYAASSNYSTIKSYSANIDGAAYTGNPATSDFLSTSGSLTVSATVTDARGYKTTVTQTITVIAYQKPRVVPYTGSSEVVCVRCDSDGLISNIGVNLLVKAGRSYSAVTIGGVQKNFCQLRYRYKAASASSYSSWVTLLEENSVTSNYISKVLTDITLNVKTAYTVQINVVDTLGEESTATVPVGSAVIAFQLGKGKRNVSIGQFCDYSHIDALDIGFTTYFNTGIAKRTIFTGSWTVGTELGAAVSSADVASVGLYTIFIAISGGTPILCVKYGSGIYGSSIKMTYTESDGVSELTLDTAPNSVTALYALV